MKVDREQFLRRLESVQPGLSQREILEQSKSFVFKDGLVHTFNDELSCRGPSGLDKDFVGAVPAEKLTKILAKRKDDEINVTCTDSEMILSRGKRETRLRLEKEIVLPVDSVEMPKKWRKLHPDFVEAVNVAQQCASNDQSRFDFTCVHVHPNHIEATDRYQICRWPLETGVKAAMLVRQGSIKHIASLGVTEFGETDSWVHFRNDDGLVLSCRRFLEEFPDLTKLLIVEGQKVSLPKGIADAVDCANEFSSENETNRVSVELSKGEVVIKGVGITGQHKDAKKVTYDGPKMTFMVAPNLLTELVSKHNECVLAPKRLKVDAGKYVWVAWLSTVGDKEEGSTENKTTEPLEETKEAKPEIVALSKHPARKGKGKKKKHEEEE